MFTGWMIAGAIIGAVAVLMVWCVIVAIFLTWYEDRHRHAR